MIEGIETAVAKILEGKTPTPEPDHRAHLLKTSIFPMIEKWGFGPEFQQEIPELHPQQQIVLDKMEKHITSGNGAIVVLVGERGLGKTSVAAQFALKIAWKNYFSGLNGSGFRKHVIYRKCSSIVGRYKPLFADFGSMEAESLRNSLERLATEQEYVVVDELHECDDMKFKRLILTDLVDRRYASKRPTILIANQTPQDFAATIGDSILSRLNQYGAILSCKWPSYRKPQS